MHALPLYHQHGLGGVHAALIAGGTVHIRSKFSAESLVQAAAGTRASVLFAVPTIYQALADSPAVLAGGLRGLRLAVCGSAPLSPSLAGRTRRCARTRLPSLWHRPSQGLRRGSHIQVV